MAVMEKTHASAAERLDHEERSSIQSLEKDAAAAIVPDHAVELDRAAEQHVLRKIDLFLIPLMWIGYGLVYYDKVEISPVRTPKHHLTNYTRQSWAVLFSSA